jgi:uncharacterized protein (DUF1015 family)
LARIVPFSAVHYNTSRFGQDLTRFVAPPYDVIDQGMEKRLKEDRLNITHITLGNENDAYQLSARRLDRWLDDEVFVRDPERAFYIYEQTFQSPDGTPRVRSGIVGLVQLEDLSKGGILPHEMTIQKHRSDRLELMTATKGDLEQIFMLYDDPTGEIEGILQGSRKREELLRFVDTDGVHHRIIKMSDAETVSRVSSILEKARLLIADGHHRYEVSLEYRDRMRAKDRPEGEMPYDFVLATLVSFRNPGLVIFPTHRLVRGLSEEEVSGLRTRLEREFEIKEYASPEELTKAVDSSSTGAFGVWIATKNLFMLASRKKDAQAASPLDGLSVFLLQERVLKAMLGFTQEMLDKKINIEYVKGTQASKAAMQSGEFQACFFVRPPSVQQVMEVARTGQRMPQKSTYFFPKIWSGTLIHLFR